MKTAALFICPVALIACAAPGPDPQSDAPPLQILFIGNSHLYTNDLPGMFARLAEAGGLSVKVDMAAKSGYLLEEHVVHLDTSNKTDSATWDIVFLQENAGVPRLPFRCDEQMYPVASVQVLASHTDYVVKRIGIDHVGISSDFYDYSYNLGGWRDAGETFNATLE